ncbi:CotH kinase family protein [Chitinophagales bacterium]|nr:CotH kinase family protein [Chitinophagales bacterium]
MKINILVLLSSFILILSSCSSDGSDEKIVIDFEGKTPASIQFNSGELVTEHARSGSYSVAVSSEKSFGGSVSIPAPINADKIRCSVYRHSSSSTVGMLVVQGGDQIYSKASTLIESDGDWDLLQVEVTIPVNQLFDVLKIYVWNPTDDTAYFDDLTIELFKEEESLIEIVVPSLELNMDKEAEEQLQFIRKRAIEKGFLIVEDDDWVDATFVDSTKVRDVEVRLKGDWTDHLKGDKWSFRVKTGKEDYWDGMRTFSLQSPATRGFLNEWIFHKALLEKDILATKYQFAQLKVNGEDWGVYNVEEHFDKHLVEKNARREGPIVKFDEDGFWEMMYRNRETATNMYNAVPFFESSEIDVFKRKSTLKNESLSKQFDLARSLMLQYHKGTAKATDVFDVERLAEYLAIVDLFGAYHATRWHNQRFYYNPIIARLEPIGFDGFGEKPHDIGRVLIGMNRPFSEPTGKEDDLLFGQLFQDTLFYASYVAALEENLANKFVDSLLIKNKAELRNNERLISKEFFGYSFNEGRIRERLSIIENHLNLYSKSSIKVYLIAGSENKTEMELMNFQGLPLEVVGIGSNSEQPDNYSVRPIIVSAAKKNSSVSKKLTVQGSGDFLFVRILGSKKLHAIAIIPYEAPAAVHPRQELHKSISNASRFLKETEETIEFLPGKHTIRKDIVVPMGKRLVIGKGTQIDLIEGAGILSYSGVQLQGTAEQPIRIFSSDKTSTGFVVLQPKENCLLSYVEFDGLSNWSKKNWELTGAVNFYEAVVEMKNCSFSNNSCEDGLNLVRSSIAMTDCSFTDTFADAFDCDFCIGSLEKVSFLRTGNDALDLSGSNFTLSNISFSKIGDKAISCGEASKVDAKRITINGATTAIASKDKSVFSVDGISISNCGRGFWAFQKKPEFGPATISVIDLEEKHIVKLEDAKDGSVILIDVETNS